MATNKKSFIGVFDKHNVNKFYNIYTSDASISELREFASLPANSLIISSPISQGVNSYDLGTPAIVMTDSYGTPVTLTYTFSQNMFSFNEKTNTVDIGEVDSLQNRIDQFKKEIEEIKTSVEGSIGNKFKQLCSSKAILDNGDRTSTVSFIDNTTYSLKLEKWTNQTLTAYKHSTISDIIIPGPQNSINSYYVFGYYGRTGTECTTCLGYWIKDSNSFDLVKKSYAGSNNNCVEYITNYSLMNKFDSNSTGNNFLSVFSNTTGLYMNDIIGVGDSKNYIVTRPIYIGNERVGSYTFLKFPTTGIPSGETRRIQLQMKEGNKCVASNTYELNLNWRWDPNDLPTTVAPSTTAYPPSTTPFPTVIQTTTTNYPS